MSKGQRLLITSVVTAAALLLALGITFAAPDGTVILDPPTTTGSGLPGAMVTYTLRITNTGGSAAFTDTFTLNYAGNQWPVDLPVTEIPLMGGAGTSFIVRVTIPSTATATSDTVTITVYQQGSPLLPSSRLTTRFFRTFLPIIAKNYAATSDVCQPIAGEPYETLPVASWQPAERPAELHADLNLALRGYTPTTAFLGVRVDLGSNDPGGPQLAGLFSPARQPNMTAAYRVYDWLWGCNCRGDPIDTVEVSLIDLAATPGETVHVPDRSGGDIGNGYKVLVLYASQERLTLKYTREDTIVNGYGLHLENICVDANLLALYQASNSAGRHELPALQAGQAVGRARSDHVGVEVRDTGWMDPRARDWWHGY